MSARVTTDKKRKAGLLSCLTQCGNLPQSGNIFARADRERAPVGQARKMQIIKRSEAVLARVSERRLLRERFAIGEASTKYHRNRGGLAEWGRALGASAKQKDTRCECPFVLVSRLLP